SIRALLGTAGVKTRMPWTEAERRLRFRADDLVQGTLEELAKVSREHGAVPVFIALDNVIDSPRPEPRATQDEKATGFLVFNLLDLWQGRDKATLRLGEFETHPNAAGARVIADRLFELMQQHRSELQLDARVPR